MFEENTVENFLQKKGEMVESSVFKIKTKNHQKKVTNKTIKGSIVLDSNKL